MTPCCPKMRDLPGGPMCPLHGRKKPPAAPRRPSTRPHWSSANRFHDGLTRREADDAMCGGLIRALEHIAEALR